MNTKLDAVFPLLAALLVLLSSMWKPETTLGVSLACLILMSLWFLWKRSA